MWSQVEEALNQSAARVLTGAAALLPGIIALLIALVLGAVLGWIVGLLVRHALRSVDFDRRMSAWGASELAGWEVQSPTLLLTRLAAWLVVLVGAVIGLAAFDPTLTSQLMIRLVGSAVNLVTAMVILIVGNVSARFLSRSVLITLVNMKVPAARLLSVGARWLVLVMATAMALNHLSIGGRIIELAFGILFGGIVLTLALLVGLRPQRLADWSLDDSHDAATPDTRGPLQHL